MGTAIPNNQRHTALWRWSWVVIFATGFAWVESAVVIYLREIYFDGSFSFPIVVIWNEGKHVLDDLMRIEIGREAATLIMLAAVGCAAGRNRMQRFSFFMIAFGIWDIFYYVWLKVLINWPESLMTWDLLFFIPLPWVGPVITPVLIALAMTIAGSIIIFYDEKGYGIRFRWYDWVIILGCGALLIAAFCWDWKNIMRIPDGIERSGIPNPFFWGLYFPALIFSFIYLGVRFRHALSEL
jgi:hypothetical protein